MFLKPGEKDNVTKQVDASVAKLAQTALPGDMGKAYAAAGQGGGLQQGNLGAPAPGGGSTGASSMLGKIPGAIGGALSSGPMPTVSAFPKPGGGPQFAMNPIPRADGGVITSDARTKALLDRDLEAGKINKDQAAQAWDERLAKMKAEVSLLTPLQQEVFWDDQKKGLKGYESYKANKEASPTSATDKALRASGISFGLNEAKVLTNKAAGIAGKPVPFPGAAVLRSRDVPTIALPAYDAAGSGYVRRTADIDNLAYDPDAPKTVKLYEKPNEIAGYDPVSEQYMAAPMLVSKPTTVTEEGRGQGSERFGETPAIGAKYMAYTAPKAVADVKKAVKEVKSYKLPEKSNASQSVEVSPARRKYVELQPVSEDRQEREAAEYTPKGKPAMISQGYQGPSDGQHTVLVNGESYRPPTPVVPIVVEKPVDMDAGAVAGARASGGMVYKHSEEAGEEDPGEGTEEVADKFLDNLKPHAYTYKSKSFEPTEEPNGGVYLGTMAQDVEKTPHIGHTIVKEDKSGLKHLDRGPMLSAMAASMGYMHNRIKKLEGR